MTVTALETFFSISVPPTGLEILEKPTYVSEGKSRMVTCQATGGYPPPEITWWIGTRQLSPQQTVSIFPFHLIANWRRSFPTTKIVPFQTSVQIVFNLGSFSIFHTPASQFSQKSSWSKYNLLYSWRFLQLITKIILITVGYFGEGTPTDAIFFSVLIKSYRGFQYLHQQQEIILMININLLEKRISRSSN